VTRAVLALARKVHPIPLSCGIVLPAVSPPCLPLVPEAQAEWNRYHLDWNGNSLYSQTFLLLLIGVKGDFYKEKTGLNKKAFKINARLVFAVISLNLNQIGYFPEISLKDDGVSQETNRILVLEEAVAGLLRRARALEARIAELENCSSRTALRHEKDDPASAIRKPVPDRVTSRPYTWADLGKTEKSCT